MKGDNQLSVIFLPSAHSASFPLPMVSPSNTQKFQFFAIAGRRRLEGCHQVRCVSCRGLNFFLKANSSSTIPPPPLPSQLFYPLSSISGTRRTGPGRSRSFRVGRSLGLPHSHHVHASVSALCSSFRSPVLQSITHEESS